MEKLEALVDASGLDQTKSPDKPRRRQPANTVAHDSEHVNRTRFPQDNVKQEVASQQFSAPDDPLGFWRPIPDLGRPRDGNFNSFNQMDALTSSLGNSSVQATCSASALVEPVGAECISASSSSFGTSQAEDSKYGYGSSGSESGLTPGTPEIKRMDPKSSMMELYHGSSSVSRFDSSLYGQQSYADALSLNPMAQLNAPYLPVCPIAYPSQ